MPVSYLDRLLDERTSPHRRDDRPPRSRGRRRARPQRDRAVRDRPAAGALRRDRRPAHRARQRRPSRRAPSPTLAARIEAGRERTTPRVLAAASIAPRPTRSRRASSSSSRPSSAATPAAARCPPVEVPDFLDLEQRALITTTTLGGAIQPFVWSNEPPVLAMPLVDAVSVVRVSLGRGRVGRDGPRPGRRGRPRGHGEARGDDHDDAEVGDARHDRALVPDHPPGARRRDLHPAASSRRSFGAAWPARSRPTSPRCSPGATLQQAVDANLMHAIRIGVGLVESAGYNPNAVLLNPADYAALDIARYENANTGPEPPGRPSGASRRSRPRRSPPARRSSATSRRA